MPIKASFFASDKPLLSHDLVTNRILNTQNGSARRNNPSALQELRHLARTTEQTPNKFSDGQKFFEHCSQQDLEQNYMLRAE
jgi:hypothetical protein